MGTNTGHVMTLANSIIGVSVLAMPFCFKQCGIVLATLMLVLSSIMTRLACYYLIKSAILARRRNFEFLAFHIFGPTGKLTVELGIIGFMLGTCVAFFVVVGDLGPAILGPILGVENPSSIRATVLTGIALFVVLPLGLLRNVDSLAAISAATIAFYICLVLKVMGEATTHLVAWDWMDKVYLWRPAGLLQCIPIFSMALSCQTQLFEIFDSIPNCTLDKMTVVVRSAVNLCTFMYVAMGFFGYIAFCTQPFSGNLMLSFSPTPTSEVIKMGFVLSVAVSFPLVIFPCRASLHSLLFRRGIPPHHELLNVSNHMPENRFKLITAVIVTVSLVTGLLIPNIELVLGLVGSTIGVLICVIIPSSFFLCLSTKNNNERLVAQVLFVVGVLIMVLGSYANLYATEKAIANNEQPLQPLPPKVIQVKTPEPPTLNVNPQENKQAVQMKDQTLKDIKDIEQLAVALPILKKQSQNPDLEKMEEKSDVRKEPPIPEEKADIRKEPPIPEAPIVKVVSETSETKLIDAKPALPEKSKKIDTGLVEVAIERKEEVIHNDAFKKEDDEIKEVQKQEILKKKEELIVKLEENELKQKKILEEQKKLLQDIKIEKEKLKEENEQLSKKREKERPADKLINEKISVENEVFVDKKEVVPISGMKIFPEKSAVNDLPDISEPKVIKKVSETIKESVKLTNNEVIKDDLVKKSMAEGLPLPIAVQHIAPHVEAIKTAKIVSDNTVNKKESLREEKVLRREILGDGGMKELREKRDVEAVLIASEYLKSGNTYQVGKLDNLYRKEEILNLKEDGLKLKSGNFEVETDQNFDGIPLDQKLKNYVREAVVNKEMSSNNQVRKDEVNNGLLNVEVEKEINEGQKSIDKEQCADKDKNKPDMKFSDELKLLEGNKFKDQTKVASEIPKTISNSDSVKLKKDKMTESIVKAPEFLSDPHIVLPSHKMEDVLDNHAVNDIAKPMKRDLKSVVDLTQHEQTVETEA